LIRYLTKSNFSYPQLGKADDALLPNWYSAAEQVVDYLFVLLELVVVWFSLMVACLPEHGTVKFVDCQFRFGLFLNLHCRDLCPGFLQQ
jgi:hypothetical protein